MKKETGISKVLRYISLSCVVLGLMIIGAAGCEGGETVKVSPLPFPQSIASGDPRSDSVVLWTRVVDDELPGQDLTVNLTVATDEDLENVIQTRELVARAEYDNCVKVRINDLDPRTFYYYRFTYNKGKSSYCSKTGRTKTAPAPGDNVPVRWAFFTGQDFLGRYYNSFAHLLNTYNTEQNDLDFLVHTGDYVYETTGDPVFQTRDPLRVLQFQDTAGAIELGEPGKEFFAAKSLSNYRDLYKTYRSDEMLQQLHERFPMIVIWDDHEYADDSWQDVATHFSGRVDEKDPVRKRNAEQAFFEYIPIEVGLGADNELEIGEDILYPNTRIYRNFSFGANVDLIMTDYRTYRPDHLIPEDAFPGTIFMDEATTESFLGAGNGIEPYINIDAPEFEALKTTMTQLMMFLYVTENEFFTQEQAQQKAAEVVTGNLSARYINGVFDTVGLDEPFNQSALDAMPHGIAFLDMAKMDPYTRWGSRYVVTQDVYSVYATYLNSVDTNVDEVFGATQENWFKGTLDNSTATWKIFVSSVSAAPMILDFSNPDIAALLPEEFPWHYRIQLNNDQWDGFPVKKQEMLNYLSTIPGTVIISGDIHASFVADHGDRGGVNRVYEFTCPSASSGTIQEMAATFMASYEGMEELPMEQLGSIFKTSSIDNPISGPSEVVWTECNQNGYVVMEATEDAVTATFHYYPPEFVHDNFYDNFHDLEGEFSSKSFRIQDGQLTQLP